MEVLVSPYSMSSYGNGEGSAPESPQGNGNGEGSAPESPRGKVKILCSHGGKILPRPGDGHLKYVGGETRIISVPREIKFQELMKKLTYLIEGDMVLKYQLVPEDLDALVTVRSDEDLSNMFDEYDRNENSGSPRLRTLLFPVKPTLLENHKENHTLQQRYIDAINGCIRAPTAGTKQRPIINVNRSSIVMSPSDCASPSPRSPENSYIDVTALEPIQKNYHSHGNQVYRVHSSPSISNLNAHLQSNLPLQQHSYDNYHINSRQPHLQSHHSKLPIGGPERLISVSSVGRVEGSRFQVDQTPTYLYSSSTKHRCMHHDDSNYWSERRLERGRSLPPSPLSSSPRANNSFSHQALGESNIRR